MCCSRAINRLLGKNKKNSPAVILQSPDFVTQEDEGYHVLPALPEKLDTLITTESLMDEHKENAVVPLHSDESKIKNKTTLWQAWNYYDNLLTTFVSTGYTTSSILTGLFAFEELGVPGLSWWGMVGSIPLSVFFSWCVANAHDGVNGFLSEIGSGHHHGGAAVSHSHNHDDVLTRKQKIQAWGHFTSDVSGSLASIILLGETTLSFPFLARLGLYSLYGMWKCGATRVEVSNSLTSRNALLQVAHAHEVHP